MSRLVAALRRRGLPVAAAVATLLLAAVAATAPSASGAYSAVVTNSTDTAGTAPYFLCSAALAQDRGTALFQWPLSDAAGSTTVTDISGNGRTGTYQGAVATSAAPSPACPRDGGTAWDLDGTSSYAVYPVQQTNPQVFTVEVWFRTTTPGGKLIGFGGAATGASATYDRHLYLTTTGAVVFGVYSGTYKRAVSPTGGYADGAWHQAVGTLSTAGMVLSIDGKQVATNPTATAAEAVNGYWRVGYDSISASWTSPAPAPYFKGQLRYAAVYTSALSAAQISAHWGAGSGS